MGRAPGRPTREILLAAALGAFTEQTYGGTSMAVVAERAGIAVGTIYRHFPSKEALGNAIYLRCKARLLDYLHRDAPADEDVRAAFGRVWRALLSFAEQHPEALAFLEYHQHDAYLDAQSRAVAQQIDELGIALVQRGQQAGLVRLGDAQLLVSLVYGAFVGLARARPAGLGGDDEQRRLAEEAAWGMLRRESA